VNILHTELHARSHAFFSWWTPPEPFLEDRARRVDVATPTIDATES
jgi:hypothetical protein